MAAKPEAIAREKIDKLLEAAGWAVQDRGQMNLWASRGVAVREVQLGKDAADYMLFVDQQAVGVVEAKPEGMTLTGVELQSAKYSSGVPDFFNTPVRPLPFLYESTGIETRFTNLLDPEPRSRRVFSFHRPETLAEWLGLQPSLGTAGGRLAAETGPAYDAGHRATLRRRLREMPPLIEDGLWPAQAEAVKNLERSLAEDRPRALIQMATGSGKTFTAITSIYRLIKFGGARRVLFLVDRANLGRQAYREFQAYTTPDDGRKFTELYNVQLMTSNKIDPVARVCITTIQRLYSMLQGDELAPEDEEGSMFDTAAGPADRQPAPVEYNPAVPIETFDVIFTDECHRSIYNLWRQVLEYFDAYLIGLTATPSKQTIGFFNSNLVMEYGHHDAVIDGVNVGYTIYRIRTKITEQGSTIEAGYYVDRRDRLTRAQRWELLDEDLEYSGSQVDRDVVAMDQIRTVIRTFKEKLFTEIFPGRSEVPKTLIFAKDDSHADDIVQIVREEFGKGNEFAQKITYRTTGAKPEELLQEFRNSYYPRIVVTVDMIATGTDIKPLEAVMFMRNVKSRNFFEQMKGRGVRVINDDDLRAVSPDAPPKTGFVIIDCVGVTEQQLSDSPPLEKKPGISFQSLLNAVAYGSVDPEVLSSTAARLARLDKRLSAPDREKLAAAGNGLTLKDIARGIVDALDPDRQMERAREIAGGAEPSGEQLARAKAELLQTAAMPLASNPELRNTILEVHKRFEQTIDTISQDEVLEAGFRADEADWATELIQSWREFIE
ncbi:MAG TPA: DEAD/DEAH box helicase family protein, partial [Thermomicrobiales bacterium]|nr:DEAD/DEAH box helicase family protein [Thermomicrobiales bacterium]